jgi:hypothetical protein
MFFVTALHVQAPATSQPDSTVSLHGDTLVVQTQNFSVVGPPGWHWAQQSVNLQEAGARAFTAVSPAGDSALAVVAVDIASWGWRSDAESSFVRGFEQSALHKLPARWTLHDVSVAASPVPASPNALRLRAILTDPNGTSVYRLGYLVPGKLSYWFLISSSDDVDPPALQHAVQTFRLLDPRRASVQVSATRLIGNPRAELIGLVVLFGAFEVVTRLRTRRRAVIGPPGMTFVSRLLIFIGIVAALLLTIVEVRVSDSSDLLPSGALGAVSAVVAMAATISYWVYGRRSKRKLNKFAWLFCGLCLIIPILSAVGNAAR